VKKIRDTVVAMPKFECTVCKLQPADLAAVESALANGTKFRELAQQCGFSKSALHRHWSRCANRRRLAEIKNRRQGVKAETRIAVQWPGDPTPDADVVVAVSYDVLDRALLKNPAALGAAQREFGQPLEAMERQRDAGRLEHEHLEPEL